VSPARNLLGRLVATLVLTLSLAVPAAYAAAPPLDRIIVVVMENKSHDQVWAAPYTLSLWANGVRFANSFGVTHPSQPNYIAMWAGSLLGITNNNCPAPGAPSGAENLGHACEAAGVSWRAYSENLAFAGSSACSYDGNATSGLYTRKHDPWTQFANLDHNRERPYSDLAVDIAANQLPRLVFVIPNNCHNSHNSTTPGCSISNADIWLQQNVPMMLNALGPRGLLILTWDEDDNLSGNRILTVFAGPMVQHGITSSQTITHYTINRLISEALGLPIMGHAQGEASITNVWAPAVHSPTVTWGKVKAHYR